MKILIVNRYLCPKGGVETYIKQLGEYYSSQGHSVEYFGCDSEKRWVQNTWNVYVKPYGSKGMVGALQKKIAPMYSKNSAEKMTEILQKFHPDIVHLNNFENDLTPSVIAAFAKWRRKNSSCGLIATAHSYDFVCPNHTCFNFRTGKVCEKCLTGHYWHCVTENCMNSSWKRMMVYAFSAHYWRYFRSIYSEIDRIVCCSNFMKQKTDVFPQLADKTVMLHNYIDRGKRPNIIKGDYVLYFGRYTPEKGIRTLINVCKQLRGIRFVFAGQGAMISEMEDIPNLTDVGFLQGKELSDLISRALFSVYPSEWYENCPFSVLESICLGTPVIAANIGGIPELIMDDYNGKLFESGSVQALRGEMESLYHDRTRLGLYTENCFRSEFNTLASYSERLMEIYKEAIQMHKA